MDSRPISLLLADEHQMYREALALTLSHNTTLTIAAQCGNGSEVIQEYEKHQPDVVILDITVQSLKGFDTTSQLLALHPQARIIWMSTFFNKFFFDKLAGSGVRGYMTKSMSHLLMIKAVQKVYNGETFIYDHPE